MGDLQWALLIFCIVLVAVFFLLSRRASNRAKLDNPDSQRFGNRGQGDQMDLLKPASDDGEFDELGVGKARKAGVPSEPSAPSMATLLETLPGQATSANNVSPKAKVHPSPLEETSAKTAASTDGDQKTIALIIAPTEEKDIMGPQIHSALAEQGLSFGEGDVYHRQIGGKSIFSVSSLLKPGKLVPTEAETFSTKGLTAVLSLPGPVSSAIAFDDLLETANALASALQLDIFDPAGNKVDSVMASKLRIEVEDWSRANKLA